MPRCKSITKYIPASCAWILLLSATTLFFVFPCQYLQQQYHFSVAICQGIITFFVISNFFLATFMDPGIIKKASPDEDKDDDFRAPLYKNVEINGITVRMKWCVTCQFYRPPRCSHCSVCNTCIETFDHHCPWVNNCIGRRNYRHFFFFLIFLSVHMVSIFVWCILFILDHREKLHDTSAIITLVIIAIIALLFIPVIGLTGFHIVLVARGRTTNEQVTGKFQGGFNPFSRGCCSNCCYTLCGPHYPKHNTRKKSSQYAHFHQYNSLNASSGRGDNSVRVYMDNTNNVLLNSSQSRTNNITNQQNFQKTSSSSACRSDGVIPLDRIDSTSQSQSRDCEPSPPMNQPNRSHTKSLSPLSPSSASGSFIQSNYPSSSSSTSAAHHPHSHHHYPPSHYTKSQQSYHQQSHYPSHDVSYQITMRRTENGKTETTFPVTSERPNSPSQIAINTGHSSYYTNNSGANYYGSQRPVSPAKSTSISEISSQTQNRSGGPIGGMVIYYSPDANCMTETSKFCSDPELQHLRDQHHHQQIIGGETSDHSFPPHVNTNNSSSHASFSKRPMSFMKALEMADKIDHSDTVGSPKQKQHLLDAASNDDRQSQYEMNYEISV